MGYDATEQDELMEVFAAMLKAATADGGAKRAAGLKAPWYEDSTHEVSMESHQYKWKKGELKDADSGAHPLVHKAWRCLAQAYQETYGRIPPTPAILRAIRAGAAKPEITRIWESEWGPIEIQVDDTPGITVVSDSDPTEQDWWARVWKRAW